MMKQFDHMIERKLNLELSNVFPRLKFLAGCGIVISVIYISARYIMILINVN
jgi:hypothetical protein